MSLTASIVIVGTALIIPFLGAIFGAIVSLFAD